jgi:hypothetical protein
MTTATAQLTSEQIAGWALVPVIVLLCVALTVTQVLSTIAQLKLGAVIAADRRSERRRRIVLATLIAAVLVWTLLDRGVWIVPVLLALGSALLLALATPSAATAILGVGGVQRGWHARRFESLEEWRLTGDHLRFRLFGEWTSVPCPQERQAEIRAKLVELVPERESPFQD